MFLIPQLPPPTFKAADKWSAPCNAFLARALKKDPRERPDAATLLQDPFMQEGSKLTPDLLLELFARAKGRVRFTWTQRTAHTKTHWRSPQNAKPRR